MDRVSLGVCDGSAHLADTRVMQIKPVVYRDNRLLIPQAALLLWRPTSLFGRAMAKYDRSPYCHAGMAAVGLSITYSLEFLQWRGGVRRDLGEYVRDYPGKIDVYAPPKIPSYDPEAAVAGLRALIRTHPKYGRRSLFRVSRWYVPGIRLIGTPQTDDTALNGGAPHCSQARALADRMAGRDFVHNTPPHMTTPGDYGRCPDFRYLFTLFDSLEQIQEMEARQ